MNNDLLVLVKLVISSAVWGLIFGLSIRLFKYFNNL